MASNNRNLCVICQDGFNSNDKTIVPLPCMHTYHLECIKGYVCSKQMSHQDIDCPICRQPAFQYGTPTYNVFCASLSETEAHSLRSDVKVQETSLSTPRRREPSTPVIQHVTITIPDLRTFNLPQNNIKSSQIKWIFLVFILIILIIVTISIVVLCN